MCESMSSIIDDTEEKMLDKIRNQYQEVKQKITVFHETVENHKTLIENMKKNVSDTRDSKGHANSRNKKEQVERKPEDTGGKDELNYREMVKLFLKSSTLHGLGSLVDSRIWVRVLWFGALTGAVFVLSLQCFGLTRDYLTFGVLTDVDIKQGEMAFPAVTVCNNRRFLTSRLINLPLFSNASLNDNSPLNTTMLTEMLSKHYNDLTLDDFSLLGADVSDSIGVSTFPVDGEARIEAIPFHGSCYSVITPADTTFIVIAVNLHADDSVDTFDTIKTVEAGATLYMKASPKAYPTYEPAYSIEVKPGSNALNEISHDVINRLNGSYAQCQDDENSFLRETGVEYEQQACLYNCEFQAIISKCRCLSRKDRYFPFWLQHTLRNMSRSPSCKLESDGKCVSYALRNRISCACKPKCHSKLYNSKSLEKFVFGDDMDCLGGPDSAYCRLIRKWLPDNITSQWIKTNIAGCAVRLSQKPYTTYSQKPGYPLLRFLADNGGTMGFYLGASMLTYFELVQLSVSTILYLKTIMVRKWRKNNQDQEGV